MLIGGCRGEAMQETQMLWQPQEAAQSSREHREKLEAAGVEWDPAVSCGGSAFSISSWQPAPQQCGHWGNLLETSSLQQPPEWLSGQ